MAICYRVAPAVLQTETSLFSLPHPSNRDPGNPIKLGKRGIEVPVSLAREPLGIGNRFVHDRRFAVAGIETICHLHALRHPPDRHKAKGIERGVVTQIHKQVGGAITGIELRKCQGSAPIELA